MTMETQEKIAFIEKSGFTLAFDGCHKIYVMENPQDQEDMFQYGYDRTDFHPASEIRRLINQSCGLVFVHPASLRDAPWDIQQGDIYDAYGDDDV